MTPAEKILGRLGRGPACYSELRLAVGEPGPGPCLDAIHALLKAGKIERTKIDKSTVYHVPGKACPAKSNETEDEDDSFAAV